MQAIIFAVGMGDSEGLLLGVNIIFNSEK